KSPWVILLIVFIPLGYMAHGLKWNNSWIFILNFLAMIPLAILFEFAIKDASLRFGQTIGGLLNAISSNTVELITSIAALKKGQIRVVQASICGSIILCLLLILGICFVSEGISYKTQKFNRIAAQTNSSLMTLACISLIIPAAFNFSVERNNVSIHEGELLNLSRATAIVLLIIYTLYLLFQLKTHSHIYHKEQKEDEEPQLSLIVSIILLAVVTVAVSFSVYLIDSIEGIVKSTGLSETFIGLILLPIINKSAELLNAVIAAVENKTDLDFAISVATGSSMHISFFVSPLVVILGWIIGQDMTLSFELFETIILFISVMMTNHLVQGGETHWLKGVILLATYIMMALAFFFYPN
ncbi:Sodium/calcium exchanger protein, partial [Glomus cerebriforme]